MHEELVKDLAYTTELICLLCKRTLYGMSMTEWGRRPRSCAHVPRVIVFDIDNTCTIGADAKSCPFEDRSVQPAWPGTDAVPMSGTTLLVRDAIAKAEDHGYKIAFATSENHDEAMNSKQMHFIQSIYPKADDAFFESVYYQTAGKLLGQASPEYSLKQPMLMNILGKNGMNLQPDEFECSIFVDDEIQNLADARRMGLQVVQASPECGGTHCTIGCGLPSTTLSVIDREQSFPSTS